MRKVEDKEPKTGVVWQRISKQKAKKLYENGKEIGLQACEFLPFGLGGLCVIFQNQNFCFDYGFEKRVKNFEWHNCPNYETGKYVAFYVKKSDLL